MGDDLRTSLSANIGGTLDAGGTVSGGTPDFLNTYGYDSDGNLSRVVQQGQTGGNGVTRKEVDFGYDEDNELTSIDRYQLDASGDDDLAAHSESAYDDQGNMTSLSDTQGTTELAGYAWTYDADGRVTDAYSYTDTTYTNARTSSCQTWAHAHYNYDAVGQLSDTTSNGLTTPAVSYTNWTHAPTTDNSQTYDANGNPTGAGQVVGSDNQLQSAGGYQYGYDAEGNRIARWVDNNGVTEASPQAGDTSITTYSWDNRNRLVEIDSFGTYAQYAAGTPTQVVKETYDVANRWIGETVTTYATPGGAGTLASQQQFVYDGNEIVLSFDGSTGSSLTNRYLWGPAVDQLLRRRCSTPATPGQTTLNGRRGRLGLDRQSRHGAGHGGV